MALNPWMSPNDRYYYGWAEVPWPAQPTDGDIKAYVVDRLHENTHTRGCKIRVDVKQGVVILGGEVPSWVAKRSAGDDAWDSPGVVDVSNQLKMAGGTQAPELGLDPEEPRLRRCEVCGNEYDKAFEVVAAGARHTFDSFECAIHRMAPICEHCACRVIGHGTEVDGRFFCCARCARVATGTDEVSDRVGAMSR